MAKTTAAEKIDAFLSANDFANILTNGQPDDIGIYVGYSTPASEREQPSLVFATLIKTEKSDSKKRTTSIKNAVESERYQKSTLAVNSQPHDHLTVEELKNRGVESIVNLFQKVTLIDLVNINHARRLRQQSKPQLF